MITAAHRHNHAHRIAVAITIVSVAACTLNPTEDAAAKEFVPPLCQRLQECLPKNYRLAYPNDTATDRTQCEQKGYSAVKEPTRQDACTQKQLDTCTADLKVEDCALISDAVTQNKEFPLPTSCNGC